MINSNDIQIERSFAIYGGGFYGLHFCDLMMSVGYQPKYIIDKNELKHGIKWNGIVPIVSIDDIYDKNMAIIICMMDVGMVYQSVCEELDSRGFINHMHLFDYSNISDTEIWINQRNIIKISPEVVEQASKTFGKVKMNLSDELSIKIYDQIVEALKSNNRCSIDSLSISNQYIANDIFLYKDEDVIVDIGGGPNGEYYEELMNHNIKFKEYYLFDPCLKQQVIDKIVLKDDIYIIDKGVSDKYESKPVKDYLGTNAVVGFESDNYKDLIPLDDYNFKCEYSIIKIDTEGYEMKVIKGAKKSIKNNRPVVICALYHKISDFWEIPLYFMSVLEKYRFYIRSYCNIAETVLYAVPEERCI